MNTELFQSVNAQAKRAARKQQQDLLIQITQENAERELARRKAARRPRRNPWLVRLENDMSLWALAAAITFATAVFFGLMY